MRKASGVSNEVRRGSTLRYSSPYPRSINPDPAPVKIEPSAHSSIDGASGSVAQASASVPTVVRAGPRNRKARRLISVAKRRWKIALANKVAHSTSVDPRYAPAGSGSPFQVMELVAVPRNMRYTQARAKAKPTMRRFRRLRGDVSRNRSRAVVSGFGMCVTRIPPQDLDPLRLIIACSILPACVARYVDV